MICKICNKIIKNNLGLSLHLKIHNITIFDYFVQYDNLKILKYQNVLIVLIMQNIGIIRSFI
jgi:hypothetical protein